MTDKVEEIFIKSGAVLKGHFLLTSGLHSPIYWEKFQVLQFPNYVEQLCRMIADNFRDKNVQLVAGPTTGGIILAYEVGRQLGVRSIFAEKKGEEKERVFRRGFTVSPTERVLVVDDVMTTGGSIFEVIAAVNKLGGRVLGVGILVDRSEKKVDFSVPFFACLRSATQTYKPDNCPLCAAGLPLEKRGA